MALRKRSKGEKEAHAEQSANYLKDDYLRGQQGQPIVYTHVQSVARSGLSRRILFFVVKNNKPMRITHHVANVLGYESRNVSSTGLRIDGGGMDMGFDAVQRLSQKLFGNADWIKQEWL